MRLFVYGTLMDPDVRAIVFDDPALAVAEDRARLNGFRRQAILGGLAPVLLPHPHGAVDGVLLPAPGERAMARARHFEGRHHYRLAERPVQASGACVTAAVFLPTAQVRPLSRTWDFDTWHRRHKAAFLRRAERHMNSFAARRAGA